MSETRRLQSGQIGIIRQVLDRASNVDEAVTTLQSYNIDFELMWLIMAGVNIGWPIAIAPAVILLIGIDVLLGGGTALSVRGLTGLALSEAAAWIVAGVVGGLLFILALAAPLICLGGLKETFQSSTWTLTYRELRALRQTAGLEAAPTAM